MEQIKYRTIGYIFIDLDYVGIIIKDKYIIPTPTYMYNLFQ